MARNSRNKANMAKHKVITFTPIIILSTLINIAVSLQINGMLKILYRPVVTAVEKNSSQ